MKLRVPPYTVAAKGIGRLLMIGTFAWLSGPAFGQMKLIENGLGQSFSRLPFVSPTNFSDSLIEQARQSGAVRDFCQQVKVQYRRYKWIEDPCGNVKWRADLHTRLGRPLIYAEFGTVTKETTLLLGGVHADELTPINLAFRFARYLDEHPGIAGAEAHVIIAPLVSPDGFLRQHPTRTNANGIDLNRNFFTADWYDKAQKIWQQNRRRLLAHFPGYFPNTEIETLFQIELIDRYRPDKILSIHAPLGFLDYDGPGSGVLRPLTSTEAKAKRLVKAISESSQNYKVVDYTFYPGSLGNYAGNERHIPTVTLELQTTDPRKCDAYWQQFEPGISQTIRYPFVRTPSLDQPNEVDNATPFSTQYPQKSGKKTI
ncbi:MAG: M14 family zinc carboxypeptidase [Proteobacteria bacterium]|nr:M14 family zinc carboxypeptidase [Pseudomonadota bacterium]